jgi:outer membrane protein assembly factor BamB
MFRKSAVAAVLLALAACRAPASTATRAPSRPRPHEAGRASNVVALDDEPGPVSADAQGAVVLVGSDHVVALAPDGTRQWQATMRDVGVEYPALDRHLVVASTEHAIVALDRATGAARWQHGLPDVGGPVALTASTVFATTDGRDVYAFDRETGAVRWHVHAPGTISSRGSLAYDDATHTLGVVIFMRGHGWYCDLLDARSGKETGAFDFGAGGPPSGVVAAGPARFVAAAGDTHELVVLDLRARKVTTAVRTAGAFDPATRPTVDGDFAVVVDDTGTVTAVDLADGRALWQRAVDGIALDARVELTATAVVVGGLGAPVTVLARADGRPASTPPRLDKGVPVGFAIGADHLFVSVRFGDPSGVAIAPAP